MTSDCRRGTDAGSLAVNSQYPVVSSVTTRTKPAVHQPARRLRTRREADTKCAVRPDAAWCVYSVRACVRACLMCVCVCVSVLCACVLWRRNEPVTSEQITLRGMWINNAWSRDGEGYDAITWRPSIWDVIKGERSPPEWRRTPPLSVSEAKVE